MAGQVLTVGCGSSGATYHLPMALEVMAQPGVTHAAFDLCAERTLAYAELRHQQDAAAGYWEELASDMNSLLPLARERSIRMVGSWGQANPVAAAEVVVDRARAMGWRGARVAAVTGDNVTELVRDLDPVLMEDPSRRVSDCGGRLVSAHAYLGAAPLVEALRAGADVVVVGRCTDSALFLAPMIERFGWALDDWGRLGRGVIIGHLLECGVQVTGGNYWDPPRREVEGLDRLGHPLADVEPDGSGEIYIAPTAGGVVDEWTCRKQLLHEIGDPAAYLTPDVAADFRSVTVTPVGRNRVRVSGGDGGPPPDTLKVLAAVDLGVITEGEASFAGPRALQRARKAAEVICARLDGVLDSVQDHRVDLIGWDSIFGAETVHPACEPAEVRLRVALRSDDASVAQALRREMEYQWLCVSGVSGVRHTTRPALGMYSTALPAATVPPRVDVMVA